MMCLGELIISLLLFYEAINLGIIDNDWIIIMNNHFILDLTLKKTLCVVNIAWCNFFSSHIFINNML